jgi:ABC-type tungstate transport system substrate-binding protein
MEKKRVIFIATVVFLTLTILSKSQCYSSETLNIPIIHIDQTAYTFPTVLVGEILSHTFTVSNQGNADLNIKDITHS